MGADDFRINRDHLTKLFFKDGLAELLVEGKAFYVLPSGKAARVHLFENGADYFAEGLARTVAKRKFGFIDKTLRVVIKPAYDFALPFVNGKAMVCNGCFSVASGEHQTIAGGKWGLIDRSGAVIMPLKYSREEIQRSRKEIVTTQ